MAIAKDGVASALNGAVSVSSKAWAVSPGGTLLSGNACMIASFAIISPNATPITVSSVTDSQGNTWTKLTEQTSGSGWNTADINAGAQRGHTNSVWITNNATINTTITITSTFSGTCDVAAAAFTSKFTGVNSVQPLDNNASLPKILKQTTNTTPSLTGISSNTSTIYPVAFLSCFSSNIGSGNMNFNSVLRDETAFAQTNGTEFVRNYVQHGPAATGPYSSVSYTYSTSVDNVWFIGLVLTADVQVNLAARPYAALMG